MMKRFRRCFTLSILASSLLLPPTIAAAQLNSPVTIKKSSGESKEITLQGKLTTDRSPTDQDWMLELDQPLTIYNGQFGKTFETKNLDVDLEECQNFDEGNWNGSHVGAEGHLESVSKNPKRPRAVMFVITNLDGKTQPLSGSMYGPYTEVVHLSGKIRIEKCEKGRAVFFTSDKPINVDRGGEFMGPVYNMKTLQLVGLDIRNGVHPGSVQVEGFLNYTGGNDSCLDALFAMEVKKIAGGQDQTGNKLGMREVLVRAEWKGKSEETQTDLYNKIRESLGDIDDKAEKDKIPIIDDYDTENAYIFVDGERTKNIKSIQTKEELRKIFAEFYGLK